MKNVLLPLALVAIGRAPALAQRPQYGVKAGLSLSTVTGGFGSALSTVKPGVILGAVASFPLGPRLSLRPELFFSQKGHQYSYSSSQAMDYVDLPVMLRFSPATSGVFAELGPQTGWLMYPRYLYTFDSSLTFRNFDVGYAGGVGYRLRGGWSFSLRYNGGFIPLIIEEEDFYQHPIPKVRNAALQLTASYVFARKKAGP